MFRQEGGKTPRMFTIYEIGNPDQVLHVCKYVIIATTIGNTSLKWLKTIVCYISGYPTHFLTSISVTK